MLLKYDPFHFPSISFPSLSASFRHSYLLVQLAALHFHVVDTLLLGEGAVHLQKAGEGSLFFRKILEASGALVVGGGVISGSFAELLLD